MKTILTLLLLIPILATAAETKGPWHSAAWEYAEADQSRIDGFRFYIDGQPANEVAPDARTVSIEALNLTPGTHSITLRAYTADHESAESNALTFDYDGSELSIPSLQWTLTISGQ